MGRGHYVTFDGERGTVPRVSLPVVETKRNVPRSLIKDDGAKWDGLVDEEKRYLHAEVAKQGLQPAAWWSGKSSKTLRPRTRRTK
jgi:hypothetical protein